MASEEWYIVLLYTVIATGLAIAALQPDTPLNISCVFHAKRQLSCNFSVDGVTDNDRYRCSICPHFRTKRPAKDICYSNYKDVDCPVAYGTCRYDCDTEGFCRERHMIKISEGNSTKPRCRLINAIRYFQPGKVRDLTLTPVNGTAVKVKWRKPADRDNNDNSYRYAVYCNDGRARPTFRLKSRSKEVAEYCRHLVPLTSYNISVRARPLRRGYWGELQTAFVTTFEDVPTSGPVVPDGAFSLVSGDQLMIYWSDIPEKQRGGHVLQYSVVVNACHNDTVPFNIYWTLVNISQCDSSPFDVRTYASTRLGWSKTPYLQTLNFHLFDNNHVQYVHKTEQKLVWAYPEEKTVESFSIYWCYGKQEHDIPQLVKCMGPLHWMILQGTKRGMDLVETRAPNVACILCEWQYAVSVNINNISTGMVWNALNISDSVGTYAIIEQRDDAMKTMVTVTLALLAALCVSFVCVIVIVLYRRNVICERIIIILPRLQSTETLDKEETSFTLTSKSTQTKLRKMIKPLLNDSGNVSMDIGRNQSGSSRRGLTTSTRVVEYAEEDKETNILLAEKSRTDSTDSHHDDQGHESEEPLRSPATEEEVWLAADTSGMSDYRQIACSETPGIQNEQNIPISTINTADSITYFCSSAPSVQSKHLHKSESTHSLPALHKHSSHVGKMSYLVSFTDKWPDSENIHISDTSTVTKATSSDAQKQYAMRSQPLQQPQVKLKRYEDVPSQNTDCDVSVSSQPSSHKSLASVRVSRRSCSKPRGKVFVTHSSSGEETSVGTSAGSYSALASERTATS